MTQGEFEEGGDSSGTPRDRATKIQEDILAIGGDALEQGREAGERALRAGPAGADYVRRARASTGSFAVSHALPLTLIGAGVGMLAWGLRKQSQRESELNLLFEDSFDAELEGTYPIRAREELSSSAEPGEPLAGSARHAAQQAKESVGALGQRASELAGRASDRASGLTHRAAQRVDIVRSRLNDAAAHLNERSHELSHEARERLRLARGRSRDFADENPLLVGAVALAAGVSVGLLLPATQPENRLLGQTRDRLLGDARGVLDEARGVLDETRLTAREAASQVAQRARDAAQELRGKRTDPGISH